MEEEVKILYKLLNHKIFLSQFPQIRHVAVNQYGSGIDVVFLPAEEFNYSDYKSIKNSATSLVYELAKMAGISGLRLSIYPQ
jgi:hypothetical protein